MTIEKYSSEFQINRMRSIKSEIETRAEFERVSLKCRLRRQCKRMIRRMFYRTRFSKISEFFFFDKTE